MRKGTPARKSPNRYEKHATAWVMATRQPRKAWGGAARPFLRALMKRSGIHMRVATFKALLKKGEYVTFRGEAYTKARMDAALGKVKRQQEQAMRKAKRAMKRTRPLRRKATRKKYTMVPTGSES